MSRVPLQRIQTAGDRKLVKLNLCCQHCKEVRHQMGWSAVGKEHYDQHHDQQEPASSCFGMRFGSMAEQPLFSRLQTVFFFN